jgi:hypothetical protein
LAAKAMLATIGCLAAVVAAEIFDERDAAPATDPAAPPPKALRSTMPATESANAALQIGASTIQSRPLFAPGRRPPPPRDTPAAAAVTEPPMKLVGTIVSDSVRIAVLELSGKQVSRVVGDNVGRSRITRIDPTQIRLESGDGQTSDLRLSWGTRIQPALPPPLEPSHLAFHLEK